MKKIRRWGLVFLVFVLALMAVGLYVRRRAMQTPAWYRRLAVDEQTLQAAANRMDQKLIGTFSAAREVQAAQIRAQQAGSATPAVIAPPAPITIELTEDEINAFFATWDRTFKWKDGVGKYVQDPVLVLEDHELILAGNITGWSAVISLHFEPRLENGKLTFGVIKVMAGTLPLPRKVYSGYEERLVGIMEDDLPKMRDEAKISPIGWANGSAVGAAMSELLIHILRDEPAEPVLFIPEKVGHESRSLPVEVIGVDISNKTLMLTLQPMDAEKRAALLAHLRGTQPEAHDIIKP